MFLGEGGHILISSQPDPSENHVFFNMILVRPALFQCVFFPRKNQLFVFRKMQKFRLFLTLQINELFLLKISIFSFKNRNIDGFK